MSRTTYRDPTPEIEAWGSFSASTACLAQLLYIHGRLELPFHGPDLDARIGRGPNAIDVDSGALRVLFEEGFHVRHVTGDDLPRLATDAAYLREVLLAEGRDDPAHIERMLPDWTPIIQRTTTAKLDLFHRYASQVDVINRPSSWSDVDELLADGWNVAVGVLNADGTSYANLIVRETSPGRHLVFRPDDIEVLTEVDGPAVIGARLCEGVTGYRLV